MAKRLVIHKREIDIDDRHIFNIKGLAEILSFAVQHNRLVMYYMVEIDATDTNVADILIRGNGHNIDAELVDDYTFMGTHVMAGGGLMWHIWARRHWRNVGGK